MYFSVITGDIVSSTKVKDWSLLQRVLAESVERVSELGATLPADSEIFRGDSIQIVLDRPELWLRSALVMRCHVAQGLNSGKQVVFDLRCGVGIGTISNLEASPGSSRGQAFLLSGKSLDKMAKDRRLQIKTPWDDMNLGYGIFCHLLDTLSGGWTPRQFGVLGLALEGLTQKDIGKRLGITQPSVSRHLRKVGYQAVEGLVDFCEHTFRDRIRSKGGGER